MTTRLRDVFEPVGQTGMVRCTVCGATGYDDDPWQVKHRRGHSPCPRCGKMLTVRQNGEPRAHTQCPGPRSAALREDRGSTVTTCVVCGQVDADIELGWSVCGTCFRAVPPTTPRWVLAARVATLILFMVAVGFLVAALAQVGAT